MTAPLTVRRHTLHIGMTKDVSWEVARGDEFVGRFVRREDAEAFVRMREAEARTSFAVAMPEEDNGHPVVIAGIEFFCGSARAARDYAARIDREAAALVAAERERCARIVESFDNTDPDEAIAAAAAEIRKGK